MNSTEKNKTKAAKTRGLAPGDTVRTNARYAEIVGNRRPYEGTLVRPVSWGENLWSVRLAPFTKLTIVHASLMEKVR